MKKILLALLAVSILLTSCGGSEDTDDRRERRKTTTTTTVMPASESSTSELGTETESDTVSAIKENPVTKIDPFEGLEVQFDGISPYVNVSFNNSKCPGEVQNYITFTYDEEANIANGDMVTVKAEYNVTDFENENIEFTVDEKSYQVSDMPYYVEDFSKIDCSALDTEIQQFMDAHYMYSDKDDVILNHEKRYGNGWSGRGIMGVVLGEPIDTFFFDKFNSSNVENTYSVIIKPNLVYQCEVKDKDSYYLNETNTFNYYYRIYKNNYTVRAYEELGDEFDAKPSSDVDIFACVYIKNVIAYPDNTLKYDMKLDYNTNILKEQAYYEGISSKNDSYNISEIK